MNGHTTNDDPLRCTGCSDSHCATSAETLGRERTGECRVRYGRAQKGLSSRKVLAQRCRPRGGKRRQQDFACWFQVAFGFEQLELGKYHLSQVIWLARHMLIAQDEAVVPHLGRETMTNSRPKSQVKTPSCLRCSDVLNAVNAAELDHFQPLRNAKADFGKMCGGARSHVSNCLPSPFLDYRESSGKLTPIRVLRSDPGRSSLMSSMACS